MRRTVAISLLGLLPGLAGASDDAARVACRPDAAALEALAATAPTTPLANTPCVAGFAGPYPCKNVDLLAFVPLATMECASGNSLWGWTDTTTGKEYALMGCDNGISFVDISTPTSPVYLGRLPTHESHAEAGEHGHGTMRWKHEGNSLWRDVRVYANHAFVVSEQPEHHMQVFDLTQLRSVASPPVLFEETALYEGVETVHTVAINEATGFVYMAGSNTCNGGLHIVDATDPEHPVFAGCVSQDGYTHETQCLTYSGPDADYSGHELCLSSNVDTLTIVDVTDKAAPIQISRTTYPGVGYTHQGWLTEDQSYFLLDDELDETNNHHPSWTYIWDVRDLDAPILLGHYTGPTDAIDHNLYVRGGYAYCSNYQAGVRILDVTGAPMASLAEVAFFDIYPASDDPAFNGNWNNYPFFPSHNLILSGIEQGLFVLKPNLDPNPTSLSVADVSVAEGNSGTKVLTFEVRLSVSVPQTVNVNYQAAGGTATPGVDFEPASGALSFTPGVTSRTVSVTVNGDTLDEADETVLLTLSGATGASMADGAATGTILDDDLQPTMTVSDVTLTEGDGDFVPASFVVSMSAASGRDVSVTVATANGTAFAGNDFLTRNGAVTILAGQTQATVDVQVRADDRDESDEFFFLNLTSPNNVTLADSQAIGTILDDDTVAIHGVTPPSGPAEGGTSLAIAGESFELLATLAIGGVSVAPIVVGGSTTITAEAPALAPGTVADVVVTNPNTSTATRTAGYLADFSDVGPANGFHDFVVRVALAGVTAGCGGGNYCPGLPVTRAQMAVFLLKAKYGPAYTPPPATGTVFGDVPAGAFAAAWIEELAALQITGGCGNGNYCPGTLVTRAQMAIFLLKTKEGAGYAPPDPTGVFGDVPVGAFADRWIEELHARGVTGGCSSSPLLYCPGSANTRGQMAVFLTKTFGL